jgi:short-subunit dehydrogenase
MKSNNSFPVILVTGASQGIGLTIAQRFVQLGYRVVGVARRQVNDTFGVDMQVMDVTQPEAIKHVINHIQQTYGRLDVLINNAGYGIAGPLEETPLEAIKQLYEVNVFGLLQVTKTCLPLLKQSRGIIINIGSVAGDFTIPFQTSYSMTKASVASLTEGLRQELKPFGVRVVNVKPGDTKSNFSSSRQVYQSPQSVYQKRLTRSVAVMAKDEANGLPPETVYRVCRRLISRKQPPVSVTVGGQYKILQVLKRLLPERFVQWLLYRIYGR